MDFFQIKENKLNYLKKHLKEKRVDEKIIPLLNFINSKEEFVTSSSCTGRISLLVLTKGKKDSKFFKKWHEIINYKELIENIKEYQNTKEYQDTEKTLWFRCESFILHIFIKDMKTCEKFMKIVKKAGIKRGGLINIKYPYMIELIGTNDFSFPLIIENKITLNEFGLKKIIQQSKKTLNRNFKQLNEFFYELKKEL